MARYRPHYTGVDRMPMSKNGTWLLRIALSRNEDRALRQAARDAGFHGRLKKRDYLVMLVEDEVHRPGTAPIASRALIEKCLRPMEVQAHVPLESFETLRSKVGTTDMVVLYLRSLLLDSIGFRPQKAMSSRAA